MKNILILSVFAFLFTTAIAQPVAFQLTVRNSDGVLVEGTQEPFSRSPVQTLGRTATGNTSPVQLIGSGTTITTRSPIYSTQEVERLWGANYELKPVVKFTAWHVGFEGVEGCVHSWFNWAECVPFKPSGEMNTVMRCEAGRNTITNEARLCEKCFRGEVRAVFQGWDIVVESEGWNDWDK